jgi:hypothetical protein
MDDERLRQICRANPDQWPEIKRRIFDNASCFQLIDETWHHPELRRFTKGKS